MSGCLGLFMALGIGDLRACVKVDDTVPGMKEGRNSSMWCICQSGSANETGLTHDELPLRHAQETAVLSQQAATKQMSAGAHRVIYSLAALPAALAEIVCLQAAGRAAN